jgi:hypothetical protein
MSKQKKFPNKIETFSIKLVSLGIESQEIFLRKNMISTQKTYNITVYKNSKFNK